MKIKAQVIKHKVLILILGVSTILLTSALFHRVAIADETIYLRDTLIIYKAIKNGANPFQHNVGLHGVFFKVPVALLYFITGPSILAATSTNILLGIISLLLFYQILRKHLFPNPWAYFPVALLAFSYRFYGAGTTFLREMPVLFSFLLFLYFLLERKSKLLIGLSLLLILDAKEHVFFTTAPPYALILLIENLRKEKKLPSKIIDLIKEGFVVFLPSLIYIVLMFTTNIIPVNIFIASILGLVDKNLHFIQASFSIKRGTANIVETGGTHTVKTMPQIQKTNGPLFMFVRNILNIFLGYLGKILYPRSLSFLSVPKIIAIPAIAMSYKKLKETWRNKKQRTFVYLTILLVFYLIIYILRASHGRYLFTISPIFFIYFILFLKEGVENRNFALITTALTGFFIIGGIYFEHSFVLVKAAINTLLFASLLWMMTQKEREEKGILRVTMVIVLVICAFSSGGAILNSLTNGQIDKYTTWGKNLEGKKIFKNIAPEEKIWVNAIGHGNVGWRQLPAYFRQDLGYISESRYNLKPWLPARYIEKRPELNTHSFNWMSTEDFKNNVYAEEITKVLLISSTAPEKFNMQDKLGLLLQEEWLELKEIRTDLKNKELYIFKVKPINKETYAESN